MMRRVPFELRLDSNNFTSGMARAARAATSFNRFLEQQKSPLDRVERNEDGPHTWPGDQA